MKKKTVRSSAKPGPFTSQTGIVRYRQGCQIVPFAVVVEALVELLIGVGAEVDGTREGVANSQDQLGRPDTDFRVRARPCGLAEGIQSRFADLLQGIGRRLTFFKFVIAQLLDESLDVPVVPGGIGSRTRRSSLCLGDGAARREGA